MKNRQSVFKYFIALLFAGTAISCSKDPLSGPVQETPGVAKGNDSTNVITGDTLAVVRYEDGSFVGFHEFAPGEVAIRHSRTAPKPGRQNARLSASLQISSKLDLMSEKGQSLVAIYRAIASAPDQATINRLAQAQARLTQAKAERDSTPPLPFPAELPGSKRTEGGSARTEATGCTADYFNDNYGAQWFIDNFISENKFRRSRTNVPQACYQTANDSWTKVVAMAPDFETGIHFSGERLECYGFLCLSWHWVPRWSFDIAPRGVEDWYIYSDKTYQSRAHGYNPCQRVHLGACNDEHAPFLIY
ncbi:MAG: hypothetical protein H7Z75_16580 [Ferruginibacter sp.]|nr:hypothetical protein [Cytophagales bacterium]